MTTSGTPVDLRDTRAQQAERQRTAEQESRDRQDDWTLAVRDDVATWAQALLETTGAIDELLDTPLLPETANRWQHALGLDALHAADPLTRMLDHVLAVAVRDRVLHTPEPGVVAVAYTHRNNEGAQTHLGYGFWPAAAPTRTIHARRALPLDELAGGPAATGAVAVAGVVQLAAQTLTDPRPVPASWPAAADGTTTTVPSRPT